jgi:hypothetical protein
MRHWRFKGGEGNLAAEALLDDGGNRVALGVDPRDELVLLFLVSVLPFWESIGRT